MPDLPPSELIAAYDVFMDGKSIDRAQRLISRDISLAASFAALAFLKGSDPDQATHAMARTFLLALFNPSHPDLDYLRAVFATGKTARDAAAQLDSIVKGAGNA